MACYCRGVIRCLRRCPLRVSPHSLPSPASNRVLIWLTVSFRRYDTGTISGILAMPYWQRLFSTGYVDAEGNPNVSASQESAIVSILSAGTFFGSLASPVLADRLGRRLGLILSTWVFNLGVVLHTVATSIPLFLAGRFFAGFGVGLISAMGEFKPSSCSLLLRDPFYRRAQLANRACA